MNVIKAIVINRLFNYFKNLKRLFWTIFIKAKKRTGKKVTCNTFAIKRKIVWNNLNKVVPRNENVKEFINSLDPTSLYIIYCNGTECSLSLDLAEYLYNELLF